MRIVGYAPTPIPVNARGMHFTWADRLQVVAAMGIYHEQSTATSSIIHLPGNPEALACEQTPTARHVGQAPPL